MKSFKQYIEEGKVQLKHELNPPVKKSVKHATKRVDRDNDGDVDEYDDGSIPDEITGTEPESDKLQKKMAAKEKGEKKHAKVGVAFK